MVEVVVVGWEEEEQGEGEEVEGWVVAEGEVLQKVRGGGMLLMGVLRARFSKREVRREPVNVWCLLKEQ